MYLWGFPAASCFSRGAWGKQLASKEKQKTLKEHYFLKHCDDFLTLQVTMNMEGPGLGSPGLRFSAAPEGVLCLSWETSCSIATLFIVGGTGSVSGAFERWEQMACVH